MHMNIINNNDKRFQGMEKKSVGRQAMHKGFYDPTEISTWILKKKSSLPCSANILPWTWYFKINREPNGSFIKCKTWLCVRIYVQKIMAIYTIDTYKPVVHWHTIIIMLIMTWIFDLKTYAIDFRNAFSQAEQKGKPVYLEYYQRVEMD